METLSTELCPLEPPPGKRLASLELAPTSYALPSATSENGVTRMGEAGFVRADPSLVVFRVFRVVAVGDQRERSDPDGRSRVCESRPQCNCHTPCVVWFAGQFGRSARSDN